MKKIETVIKLLKANEGTKIIQHIGETGTYFLMYLCGEFWLEAHKDDKLVNVECISEDTARFSLSARYKG